MTDPVKEARDFINQPYLCNVTKECEGHFRNLLAYIDRHEKEPVVEVLLSEEAGEDDYFFYEIEPLNKRIEPGLFRRLPEEGE